MAFPTTFSSLPSGIEPLSLFDTMFGVVGGMGSIFCTATGSNTIVLSPNANMPTVSGYANYQAYGFVASANSSAPVTISVSGVGALPAYAADGVTQLASGSIVSGVYYTFVYNSALNSGSGGFQIAGASGGGGYLSTINVIAYTSSGTYTPSAGVSRATIETWAGGGGGGGCAGASGQGGGGGGGQAGGYSRKTVTGSALGPSQSVTIGAAGSAGASGNNAGGNGGNTSVGSLCVAIGGTGGPGSAGAGVQGGFGTSLSGAVGDITAVGAAGGSSVGGTTPVYSTGGAGGSSLVGSGGPFGGSAAGSGTSGASATGYASGGAGGGTNATTGVVSGGAGTPGFVLITEYINTATGAGATTATTISSINGGQRAGLINRTINGDMRIDQRNSGASQTITAATSAAYTVDRFYATCTGANVTGQRVTGSGASQYAYQFTGAASVTGIAFGQRYEATNVYPLAGTTTSFSVKLANSLLTTVTWTAYYPTAIDNWSGRTSVATGTFTITATPTVYAAQIALPTTAQAGLVIELTVGAQTSGTWTITDWQLENGSVASPFERKPIGTELEMCQRYYQTTGHPLIIQFYSSGAGSNSYGYYSFPEAMRVSPTPSSTFSNGVNNSTQAVNNVGVDGFLVELTAASSGQSAITYNSGNTLSAEL